MACCRRRQAHNPTHHTYSDMETAAGPIGSSWILPRTFARTLLCLSAASFISCSLRWRWQHQPNTNPTRCRGATVPSVRRHCHLRYPSTTIVIQPSPGNTHTCDDSAGGDRPGVRRRIAMDREHQRANHPACPVHTRGHVCVCVCTFAANVSHNSLNCASADSSSVAQSTSMSRMVFATL